ncbi:hypothetical protein [Cylindrospermum sp. FACHB-282]|uniref:hypothetical protein n=1 Tax=Cylindrospermum sp. FACHB-282 TaxID=2692794 RepID=UPI0016854438|nr:hypothetical protein [Cylindrospermum sp. FACHB-282]MBD2387307.1 hypothetical protein [Cylindrospermum sp. FACHB-282]
MTRNISGSSSPQACAVVVLQSPPTASLKLSFHWTLDGFSPRGTPCDRIYEELFN